MAPTKVIQVTNVAPHSTKEQLQTLFGYIGRIEDIQLYPDEGITSAKRLCYVKFEDAEDVGVSLHLTNTVFIDRALIVVPVANGKIPEETTALALAAKGDDCLIAAMTQDDPDSENSVEEIRRTIYVSNMDAAVAAEQVLQFFSQAGEISYVRMANDQGHPTRSGYVEFSESAGYNKAIALNGASFLGSIIRVVQSNNAIVKPASVPAPVGVASREIEEAMKKVKEAQSLISAHVDPAFGIAENRRRSRSRSRGRHRRSRSRSRRSRSRSPQRSHSRSPSRGSRSTKRSYSPRRRSRSTSRSRGSKRRKSRSRSRGRSKRSRSRSRSRRSRSAKRSYSPRRRSRSTSRSRSRRSRSRGRRSRSRSKGQMKRKSRSRSRSRTRSDPKRSEINLKRMSKQKNFDSRLSKLKSDKNVPRSSRSRRSRSRSRGRRSTSRTRRRRSTSRPRRRSRSPRKRRSRTKSRSPRRPRKDKRRDRSRDRSSRHEKKRRDKEVPVPPKEEAKIKRDYDEEEKGFNNSDSDKPGNVDNGSDGSDSSSSSDSAASTPERGAAIPTVQVTNRGSPRDEGSSSDSGESNQQSQDMDVDSD